MRIDSIGAQLFSPPVPPRVSSEQSVSSYPQVTDQPRWPVDVLDLSDSRAEITTFQPANVAPETAENPFGIRVRFADIFSKVVDTIGQSAAELTEGLDDSSSAAEQAIKFLFGVDSALNESIELLSNNIEAGFVDSQLASYSTTFDVVA